jgi:hypothetical protein
MKRILFLVFIVLAPLFLVAQQPKMNIRIFAGLNTNTFVYRSENVTPDLLGGIQLGAGLRVSKRRAFAEGDITYINYGLSVDISYSDTVFDPITVRMNSLDVPLLLGYIALKKPVFKWYFYGGLVNRFSLKGNLTYRDVAIKFTPGEFDLHTYNLLVRFGTQIDLAMFNFDFNYSIGVTNSFRDDIRTNSHAFQLSIGYLF